MSCVIIRKKDLYKLGKKLMKEVYHRLRDDYMLNFDEVRSERDYFDKNLVSKFLIFHKERKNKDLCFVNKRYEELFTMPHEDLLKKIEDKIENETLDLQIIYDVLEGLKLNIELDEDLYLKKKEFISIYDVYYYNHTFLED